MKGIRLYLIIFGLLLALSAYLLLSRRSGSYSPSNIGFALEDTGNIEMLRISRHGETLELSRAGESWKVNGGSARQEAIRGLYVLISRIEVEAPVSNAIEERILAGFRDESAEILIGIREGPDKSYRVYYDSISGSTYMMAKDSFTAFRVRLRGYQQSNLAELFVSDPAYWRENIIFQFHPSRISTITVLHKLEPERSFHLAKNDKGEFEIAGGIIPGEWSAPKVESLRQYLGYFREVRFEAYADPSGESLFFREEPDYVINLEGLLGEQHTLELFPIYQITTGGEKRVDINRLFGRIGSIDNWILIKYVQIDPLLQDFEYFK